MTELNEKNEVITYILELELIKSVEEVKEFMRNNSSFYVFECPDKIIRFEWFLSEDEKNATLIEMFEDSDDAKLCLEHLSTSHLIDEFPEHFNIISFRVLGNVRPDLLENLVDWEADTRDYTGGFFKL